MRASLALLCLALFGQAAAPPEGITRTVVVDNPSVLIARLRMSPGAREPEHTHPFSAVVVQVQPGDVEMNLGGRKVTEGRQAGHVEFIPKLVPHAAANLGKEPFEIVAITLKPDRVPAVDAPASQAPPGITRTGVLDNDEARATRVRFDPAAREPVHVHPFDLVLVQLTPAKMEVQIGDEKTVKDYDTGAVIFLPRNVPHAVSSAHVGPFEIMSVAVK